MNLVINTLSVQETTFWREMDQISTLLGLSINHEGATKGNPSGRSFSLWEIC